jgi:transcription antitermination factor NusG
MHLRQRGFETYLPRIRTRRKQIDPLFPGYIFVRIIERWYVINSTPGIVRVLLCCDHPATLRDDVIDELRQRQDRRGYIVLPKRGPRRGQRVRITRGTFLDHVGIYDGQSGHDRERVLLALLGRMVAVYLPTSALQFS